MIPIEHDTVDLAEKASERLQEAKSSKYPKLPNLKPFTKEVVTNFSCSGCGDILPEVIALNGYIQGECGRSHTRIKVKV